MIVAANIGVVDEVALVPKLLDHLEQIGVDRIVVTDTGSVDGTAEFLRREAVRGRIRLFEVAPGDEDAIGYANRMLRRTLDEYGPDWVLFGDADEFCIPRGGDLRRWLAAADADVLQLTRLNVPVGPEGARCPTRLVPDSLGRLELIVRPVPGMRQHLLQVPDTPWILGEVLPKVIARASRVGAIAMGAHAASDPAVRPVGSDDMLIAHLPVTDEARFRRKVANIRAVLGRFTEHYPGATAWHWKRWVTLDEQGLVGDEYRRQVFDEGTLAALRSDGTIASAADWFAARAAR